MDNSLKDMKNKKVLIVGLGRSGIAACQAMVKLGAEVHVQDSKKEESVEPQLITFFKDKDVKFFLGSIPENLGYYDMLILSPGVSPELEFIQKAQEQGAEIIGELEIAYRIGKGNYVGITGTNGKTTTTTLVGEIFKASGRKTHVVGNIGVAVISASVDAEEDDWLITEASSFQLETTKFFRPHVSAILNLTPDHLNRHHTMEAYGKAKAKIFANETEKDYLVLNYDDKESWNLAKEDCRAKIVPFSRVEELEFGVFVRNGKILIRDTDKEVEICPVENLKIIGNHNLENVLAAAGICYFAGIDSETIGKAVENFRGVEHRIEFCGIVDGVKYYNDSKGTNVDAAVTAINALEKNIVLIAGGDGKSQDFTPFAQAFDGKVKELVLLGKDAKEIAAAADKAGFTKYTFCKDMEECVRKAYELSEKGDNVLLSPACASWDMYDNFEQRGEHFKSCVDRL